MSPANKIRIAMLTDYPYLQEDRYLGGVMQASFRLIQALAKTEEVDLYVISQTTHVTKKEITKEGNITIIHLPYYFHKYDAIFLYKGLQHRLKKVFHDIKPHLVHAQGNTQYILSAVKSAISHIVTIHGLYKNEMRVYKSMISKREFFRKIIAVKFERYYISRIRNLISITSEISDIVKRYSPNVRIYRIDNAIDDRFFKLTNSNTSPVILFVAAITHRKGLHMLLKAFEIVSKRVPGIKCRIAGVEHWDPYYVNSLKQEYMHYIKAGQVSFLGTITQEQLYKEMSECSLFCLPSLAESAPMVIAQAMAAGKPVVATKVGGIPEMIGDGINGRLVEPNDVNALASCIGDLILIPGKLLEMGKNARSFAITKYHSKIVAQKTVQVYREVRAQDYKG